MADASRKENKDQKVLFLDTILHTQTPTDINCVSSEKSLNVYEPQPQVMKGGNLFLPHRSLCSY